MEDHTKALEHIQALVYKICDEVEVTIRPRYTFIIKKENISVEIQFGEEEVDDYAIALEKHYQSNYYFTQENRFRFRILIALGIEGILDHIRISEELIEERGEWQKNARFNVSFDEKFCQILYKGLNLLEEYLASTIVETKVDVPELDEDVENLRYLIKYYEENGHLSTQGAEYKSLSYLKGAAICFISTIESERDRSKVSRIRKALNSNIYSIVEKLRKEPFVNISPPECASDFISHQQEDEPNPQHVADALPQQHDDIDELLHALEPRLVQRRLGAWQAFKSNNPDRLSQAANSMVELLDQVLGKTCEAISLNDYLIEKYGGKEESRWVEATRKWIGETKSNLHRVKHHADYRSEQLTESLMKSAETVIKVILKVG